MVSGDKYALISWFSPKTQKKAQTLGFALF